MGRVSDLFIEMEADATDMTLEEWIEKYGDHNVEIFNNVRGEDNA